MKYRATLMIAGAPEAQVFHCDVDADDAEAASRAALDHWRQSLDREPDTETSSTYEALTQTQEQSSHSFSM